MKRHTCGTKDNWEDVWKDRFREQLLKNGDKNVKARGMTSEHRYLETMVVADKKFIQYHKNTDLETYILTIMNMVSYKVDSNFQMLQDLSFVEYVKQSIYLHCFKSSNHILYSIFNYFVHLY